jgi:hypothetical protein
MNHERAVAGWAVTLPIADRGFSIGFFCYERQLAIANRHSQGSPAIPTCRDTDLALWDAGTVDGIVGRIFRTHSRCDWELRQALLSSLDERQ